MVSRWSTWDAQKNESKCWMCLQDSWRVFIQYTKDRKVNHHSFSRMYRETAEIPPKVHVKGSYSKTYEQILPENCNEWIYALVHDGLSLLWSVKWISWLSNDFHSLTRNKPILRWCPWLSILEGYWHGLVGQRDSYSLLCPEIHQLIFFSRSFWSTPKLLATGNIRRMVSTSWSYETATFSWGWSEV